MQVIEIPYNYITITAFKDLLGYEDVRHIKVKTLEEYHQIILKEVIKDHQSDHKYLQPKDIWEKDVMLINNPLQNLETFLKEYEHICYLKNDTIYLKDGVTYYDIEDIEINLRTSGEENGKPISIRWDSKIFYSSELRKLLNIHTIYDYLKKYLKIEEELYYQYLHDNKKIIKLLLIKRQEFLNNLKQLEPYLQNSFRRISWLLGEEYDPSEYEYSKDNEVINQESWEKYLKENNGEPQNILEEIFSDLDDVLYDIYQYAIFGFGILSSNKISEFLEMNINPFYDREKVKNEDYISLEDFDFHDEETLESLKNMIDESKEIATDEEELKKIKNLENIYNFYTNPNTVSLKSKDEVEIFNLTFYLRYIKRIDEIMPLTQEYVSALGLNLSPWEELQNLNMARKRLLYALDMPEYGLYDPQRLNAIYEKIKDVELEVDEFHFLDNFICYIFDNAFTLPFDKYTIRKLLFLGAYYDVTHDEDIVEGLKDYKSHPCYNVISQIILGKEKGNTRKRDYSK